MSRVDASTAPARPATGQWRRDAAILAAGALLIRLPALLADRFLTYDDGVFGSSALLMQSGELPFRDIFSPQGPLFLPLVFVADLLGLRTENAPRLLPLAAAAVVTVATYAAGRRLTSRAGALLAAGLVATSGSVLWTSAPITSDGPALALATTGFALALAYRARPTPGGAALVGITIGAALCVKVLVLPVVVPVGVLLLGRRRPRDVVIAAGSAVAVGLAATVPWGFDRVWEQYIEYHRNSARIATHAEAGRKLVRTLIERDALVVTASALALLGLLLPRQLAAAEPEPVPGAPPVRERVLLLGAWALGVAAVLVLEPAFWRPQLAELIPALALLAALRPPRSVVVLAAAGLAVAPWYLGHVHPMLWPGPEPTDEHTAIRDLGRLPSDAHVITDEPGLAWRADRLVPGHLVDASIKRIEQGQITTDVLGDTAATEDVCAVLVWDDRYGDLPGLPERLAGEGYEIEARYGEPRVLYVKRDCEAG